MLVEWPPLTVAAANAGAWLVIQLGLAWLFTRLPAAWFKPGPAWGWERDGQLYQRLFWIRRWKDRLPDAATWFRGGFPKARLRELTPEYLGRFIRETWRGELCHWSAIACVPLFCLWNPGWGVGINAAVAIALNVPCLLSQRYNRCRSALLLSALNEKHRRNMRL
jgi:glycosyl-4,4'-diaponeurosporenoate acyltransferase